MSIQILSQREHKSERNFVFRFYDRNHRDSEYDFPCSQDGVIDLSELSEWGRENFERCKRGEDGLVAEGVVIQVHRWIEPAKAKCHCGRTIELDDPLDNQCLCGRCYNMSGQEVTPSWKCDEQGNPYEEN